MNVLSKWPVPGLAVLLALAASVWELNAYVDAATGAAACLERAKFELVICEQAPPTWLFLVLVGITIVLSVTVGVLLSARRR